MDWRQRSGRFQLPPLPTAPKPTCQPTILTPPTRCPPRRHHALFASGRRSAAAAAVLATSNGAPAPRRRPAEPVHLLTFDDVSCTVPLRQGRRWLPRWGRRAGSGQAAPAAQAAGVTAEVAVGAADPLGAKQILKSVSGVAANGELVGVLGPSGGCPSLLGRVKWAGLWLRMGSPPACPLQGPRQPQPSADHRHPPFA